MLSCGTCSVSPMYVQLLVQLHVVFDKLICPFLCLYVQVPQLEDWPVMPVERVSFALHPSGFFDCSAVMDVPPEDGKTDGSCEVKGTRLQTLTTPAGGDGTCCASGCSAEVAVVAKAEEEEEACKCGDGGSAACKKAACSCTRHRTGAGVTLRSRL